MKELTVFEMEEISGGYTWDFSSVTSTITSLASNAVEALAIGTLGAIIVSAVGTWIGGVQGGHNGGILGLGLLGNAVGAVVGFGSWCYYRSCWSRRIRLGQVNGYFPGIYR